MQGKPNPQNQNFGSPSFGVNQFISSLRPLHLPASFSKNDEPVRIRNTDNTKIIRLIVRLIDKQRILLTATRGSGIFHFILFYFISFLDILFYFVYYFILICFISFLFFCMFHFN